MALLHSFDNEYRCRPIVEYGLPCGHHKYGLSILERHLYSRLVRYGRSDILHGLSVGIH